MFTSVTKRFSVFEIVTTSLTGLGYVVNLVALNDFVNNSVPVYFEIPPTVAEVVNPPVNPTEVFKNAVTVCCKASIVVHVNPLSKV